MFGLWAEQSVVVGSLCVQTTGQGAGGGAQTGDGATEGEGGGERAT